MNLRRLHKGFTLIELVMVILIMAIVATMTVSFLQGGTDGEKWEETRQKLEQIRYAILGERRLENGVDRARFGYFGDMGRMPTSLTVLTAAETPAWVMDTFYGVGAGWRGPYFSGKFTGGQSMLVDAWGNNLVYSTTALSSLASDNANGGTAFASDITVTFPAVERLSTVRGRVSENRAAMANEVVLLQYPVNGTLTAITTTADANGAFLFPGVPYGRRSIYITSVTGGGLGPIPFTVDEPQVTFSPNQADRFGRGAVTYNTGSIVVTTTTISVNSARQGNATSGASTITLNYTVPNTLGTNIALAVGASAEDNTPDVIPTKVTYSTITMSMVVTDYSGYSFNGYTAGGGIFIAMVTGGQKGTITATFAGTNNLRGIAAYTVAEIDSIVPEAQASFKNQDGNTTGIFTPQTDGAMVVSYAHTGMQGTFTAVGPGHTINLQQKISGDASTTAIGHLLATTAGTYAPVGYTHTGPNRMLTLMAAFRSTGRTVSATLSSTYESDQTLAYVTVRWSNSATLRNFSLANVSEKVARVSSGTRIKINSTMTATAGSTTIPLEMLFSQTMGATDFVVVFEWASGLTDTIRFTTP